MEQPSPIEIPVESLKGDLLQAVIEEFVLREGTDYGAREVSLESKVEQVRRQLELGTVKVVYDFQTETCSLITTDEWGKAAK